MLYAMIAKDKPGSGDKRTATRPVHLDHLKAQGETLVLAGALLDEAGNAEGSIMVVETETLEAATKIFMADPFITEGIFGTYEIKAWRLAFNHMAK